MVWLVFGGGCWQKTRYRCFLCQTACCPVGRRKASVF
jgi:hypothetical protein